MSEIDQALGKLKSAGKKAFIPFITAGDPDLATTAALMKTLSDCGATIIELGIPYSDPIADGPVIQASYTRALEKQIKLAQIFGMAKETVPSLKCPVAMMVSFAVIHRVGPETFVARAKDAGIAGAIVPDLLVEEADAMVELCKRNDFSLIQLVTPTTKRERAVQIARTSTGFVYYVSITGITGERIELPPELAENVRWLRSQSPTPVCVGFGISQPEHVRAIAPHADGVIVGSAIVRRVADAATSGTEKICAEVKTYCGSLIEALG